jgi:hypothetical protein
VLWKAARSVRDLESVHERALDRIELLTRRHRLQFRLAPAQNARLLRPAWRIKDQSDKACNRHVW